MQIKKWKQSLLAMLTLGMASVSASAATVDVLVIYTPSAEASVANINTKINQYFSSANSAYAGTGIDIQLRKAGTYRTGLNKISVLDIDTMKTTYGNAIMNLRNQYNADFVVILGNASPAQGGGTYCGVASDITTSASSLNTTSYFNITGIECDTLTFTHELGHNMGLTHSPAQAPSEGYPSGIYSYGQGFGVNGVYSTIMAYPQAYNTTQQYNYFSNTRYTISGYPMGIDNQADATRALNNSKGILSSAR